MNLEIGDVIGLSDGNDYAVIQKLDINKNKYLYLMTPSNPLSTVIAKQRQTETEIILETVEDKEELEYVLHKMSEISNNE